MRSSCLALAIVTAIMVSPTAIASKAVQDKEGTAPPVPTLEATDKVHEIIREDEKAKSADADYLAARDNDPKHARDNAAEPVPEPSGWALLLAGACVIGLAASRKRPAPFR
ncbi:PEP-CTERM sorting domain-containing protein [Massilia sp. erpn]|uniref:PEP-CTERM sorting domain-containing protein n=1 Tax=Massilia sp. erpn TaxID=2738142 RepID=UPI00210806D2|nr:PEP-CTERM sorting domain-containing protein [Massilia sp. erpn]UTY57510.1 PEP-CTERM sorting domain-containing protein [Massilia sp. erpn]